MMETTTSKPKRRMPSEHEKTVLRLLAEGKAKKDIAAAVFVTPMSLRNYIQFLRKKYSAINDVHLIYLAMRDKIIF